MASAVLMEDPADELEVACDEDFVRRIELADVVVLVATAVAAIVASEDHPEADLAKWDRDLVVDVFVKKNCRAAPLGHRHAPSLKSRDQDRCLCKPGTRLGGCPFPA